nr:uncharacterized protein LOC122272082 [Parasteatoda tepidariorum]
MAGVESSENTAIKRKYDENDECKYIEHKNGKFQRGSIPEHVYPLGNYLFLTLNAYKRKVKFHIRTYKLHREMYYPSKDGVTLETAQFNVLSKTYVPPMSVFDVVDINMKLDASDRQERDAYYTQIQEDKYFTLSH